VLRPQRPTARRRRPASGRREVCSSSAIVGTRAGPGDRIRSPGPVTGSGRGRSSRPVTSAPPGCPRPRCPRRRSGRRRSG
jgi:hypothetical protein